MELPPMSQGGSLFRKFSSSENQMEWLYRGDKDAGLRRGKGMLQYKIEYGGNLAPTFVEIEGEWENDVLHGFGTLTVNGTKIYEGNWVNGSMSLRKPDSSASAREGGRGNSDKGVEDSKLFSSDLGLSDPATFDALWMLCSNTNITDDASLDEQNEAANAKQSSWLSTFMDEKLNLKEHRDVLDFISISASWFMGCLIIFLIFIA